MQTKYLLEGQESERILFRQARESDFNYWLKFFEDPMTSKYWISKPQKPKVACQQWYDKQFYRYENNLGGLCALIEKNTGKLLGHCGLIVQKVDEIEEIEIGYHLLPKFWRKGFAIESATKCKNHAFKNNLTDSLISIISLTNTPSQVVAIKNGMSIDKVTQYDDNKVNIFRIRQSDWRTKNEQRK
ncbi:MAG: GNAT family N-acetyltransferase [Alcanivoracaceae bacterium]|nr:GNAT family N-acetyltransferase [Alcanivoracaceae bacterium]